RRVRRRCRWLGRLGRLRGRAGPKRWLRWLRWPRSGPRDDGSGVARPEELAGRQARRVDGGGQVAAHVAVVPGLARVAGDGLGLRWVAADEAELPGVEPHPPAGRRLSPGAGERGAARVASEVDREAELVLRVARAS